MIETDSLIFPDENTEKLFRQQKELLDTFLSHGAISAVQYEISLTGLVEKMHLREPKND